MASTDMNHNAEMRVLATGAAGYIEGILIPYLLEKGYAVRVLVRDHSRIEGQSWA